MSARRVIATSIIFLGVIVIIGAAGLLLVRQHKMHGGASSLVDGSTLLQLATTDNSDIDTSHLAVGLSAPTNKWFSGLALNKTPQPVFPLPMSFMPSETGFAIGLPHVTVTANTITGGFNPGIRATITGATSYKVTRYDEISVDLTYYDTNNNPLGTLSLAEGSPYVFFVASQQATVQVSLANPQNAGTTISSVVDDADYRLAASRGADQQQAAGSVTQTLPKNGLATYYALPTGQPDQLAQFAGNRIKSVEMSYSSDSQTSKTNLAYQTDNNQPTVIAGLPHQAVPASTLHYQSIYGAMNVLVGTNHLDFSEPRVTVEPELEIDHLNQMQKDELTTQLAKDSQQLNFQSDSYGGGKAMYRAAQLLQLAHQLGDQSDATDLQNKLSLELTTWLTPNDNPDTPKSFYYNNTVQGLVGSTPAFGSEQFNDHHFHYGYFIYAASILGKFDPEFVQKYQPMVNLIVADIANYQSGEKLPLRRVFDPYQSHSWASGNGNFGDGNNQESSSEAINAWTGISLWAKVTNNADLSNEASWLLNSETASAKTYWLSKPSPAAYTHSIVSLNWGGKRDDATFFSDSPAAKLGIQLIPFNPTQADVSSDQIKSQLKEAVPDGNYNVPLGDYLLLYDGLADPAGALQKAQSLADASIDSADSRTYLLARLMTL